MPKAELNAAGYLKIMDQPRLPNFSGKGRIMGFHMYSQERLADRAEIQDVMLRWCRAIDRLDLSALTEIFHEDAIDDHGPFRGGIDALRNWIRQRHATIPFSMHAVSNMLIEFSSDDVAVAETYVRTTQRYPADAKQSLVQLAGDTGFDCSNGVDLLTCSRYVDRFEKRLSVWKIAHRTVIHDWKQITPVPKYAPVAGPDWAVGSRNSDDPLYRIRAAAGL